MDCFFWSIFSINNKIKINFVLKIIRIDLKFKFLNICIINNVTLSYQSIGQHPIDNLYHDKSIKKFVHIMNRFCISVLRNEIDNTFELDIYTRLKLSIIYILRLTYVIHFFLNISLSISISPVNCAET